MEWVAPRGAIMDGDRRYLMLRADVLMGIFREMPAELRGPAMEAFAASVGKHGGRSAKAYLEAGGNRPQELLETIARYSRELGWGCWRVIAHDGEAIEVTVENSPFAEGFGPAPDPVCHAIVGMLQAVGTLVFGQPASVVEACCAAQQGVDRCIFRVVPAAARVDADASRAEERRAS
ncbi:MAG: 4-vinyl reductase [Burkholderiaceae bacterium]|nr:4-vinyl reductase [Burkholderiaceae bacterium]